jgi:hypothetical protein
MEQTDELTALIAAGEEILRGEEAEHARQKYETERAAQQKRLQEQERRARAMAMTMPAVFLSHLGEQEDVDRNWMDDSLGRFRVGIHLPGCAVFWAHFKDRGNDGWIHAHYEMPRLYIPQDYADDDYPEFITGGPYITDAPKAAASAARLHQEYRLAMESYNQWLARQAQSSQPEPTYIPADLADNPNVDALIASMRQFIRAEIDLSSNSGR